MKFSSNSNYVLILGRLYKEIGPGSRVALSRLAAQKLNESGRPFRVAIDVSIWLFQVQSGQGGANPALRTLYFRLVRLVSLPVEPLFVFDGPDKPLLKRNKVTSRRGGGGVIAELAKRMFTLFGFPHVIAPGEAEAECALLQVNGIVDAVLSDDVDTLMFGCTKMLRNMSGEGKSKIATHVNVYDSIAIKDGATGLDRHGIILVALMSGGDYCTAGIPHCGIKIACEAARAGFGTDLFSLGPGDSNGLTEWRERLEYELNTNESGYFKTKHKTLVVPDTFPERNVLQNYAYPTVSSSERISQLRQEIRWNLGINITGLRQFVATAFEWTGITAAKRFILHLAPAMVKYRLGAAQEVLMEKAFVKEVCGQRSTFETDGLPELRVVYVPADVVGLDLDKEDPDERPILHQNIDEEERSSGDESIRSRSKSPTKQPKPVGDPMLEAKVWVLESYVQRGASSAVERYNAKSSSIQSDKFQKSLKKQQRPSRTRPSPVAASGSIKAFFKPVKPLAQPSILEKLPQSNNAEMQPREDGNGKTKPAARRGKSTQPSTPRKDRSINPWSLASSSPLANKTPKGVPTASTVPTWPPATDEDFPSTGSTSFLDRMHSPMKPTSLAECLKSTESRPEVLPSSQVVDLTEAFPNNAEAIEVTGIAAQQPKVHTTRSQRQRNMPATISRINEAEARQTANEKVPKAVASGIASQPSQPRQIVNTDEPIEESIDGLPINNQKTTQKQSVLLRDSLPGSWKIVTEGDKRLVTPNKRYSGVEVLDLTQT